ncbi:MAG: hypothetical protein V5B44_11140 [Candidatus Accumulibacter necessarius]|uniref:hypothetical protein n=1 Tax=Candidatus Accumulibacter necessarius TaxID=2954386 RepID=UPI002FC385C6
MAIAPGNLQRLLDNLIDNALQHGAPPVEVALSMASRSLATCAYVTTGRESPALIASARSNPSPSSNRPRHRRQLRPRSGDRAANRHRLRR